MKKTLIVTLLLILAISFSFAATAKSGNFEYENKTFKGINGLWLTKYIPEKDLTILTIPDYLDSKPVTGITAFYGDFLKSDKIEEIRIPSTVTYIDSYAFRQVSSLKSFIVDPNNPKYASIKGVLYDKEDNSIVCYPQARTDVIFYVLDGIEYIEPYAFAETKNLHTVYLPNSIRNIDFGAFVNSDIYSINFPEGLEIINTNAFFNCNNIEYIDLPSTLSYLGETAFICRNLDSFYVPEENKKFTSVDGVLFSKDMTTLIAYPAYNSYGGEYIVPESVKKISNEAFCYAKLDYIYLPDELEEIHNAAFWGSWIREIYLPETIKFIGNEVFDSCHNLEEIYVEENSYAFTVGLRSSWGKYIVYSPSWL